MKNSEESNTGSVSFLVRIWKEPAGAQGESILRGYLRNLKTGEERYVANPQVLCEVLDVDHPKTGDIDVREVREKLQSSRRSEAPA